MLLHPLLILLGILLFIIFCYFASEFANRRIIRVDSDNIRHVFIALACFVAATYSLLFAIGQSLWFVLGVLIWFSIAFYESKKARKIADAKNVHECQ